MPDVCSRCGWGSLLPWGLDGVVPKTVPANPSQPSKPIPLHGESIPRPTASQPLLLGRYYSVDIIPWLLFLGCYCFKYENAANKRSGSRKPTLDRSLLDASIPLLRIYLYASKSFEVTRKFADADEKTSFQRQGNTKNSARCLI